MFPIFFEVHTNLTSAIFCISVNACLRGKLTITKDPLVVDAATIQGVKFQTSKTLLQLKLQWSRGQKPRCNDICSMENDAAHPLQKKGSDLRLTLVVLRVSSSGLRVLVNF